MSRPPILAAVAALATAAIGGGAMAADAPQPTAYLTWPGKTGAVPAGAAAAARPAQLALPRQFFGAGGDDLAAAPPPLAPRPVPGTQAANASDNTAANRARQNDILTADSAADGPVGGAEAPN